MCWSPRKTHSPELTLLRGAVVRPLSLEQFGREQCSALSNTSSLLTREQQQLSGKSNLSLEWSVLRKAITGKVSCGGVSKLLSKSRTSHNCVLVLSLVVLSLCGNSSSTDGNTLCLLPTVQNFRVDEKLSNLMPSLKKEPYWNPVDHRLGPQNGYYNPWTGKQYGIKTISALQCCFSATSEKGCSL